MINLDGLIEKINSNIFGSETKIELGDFVNEKPRRNSFLYRLDDRGLETRGKYPLIQPISSEEFMESIDIESEFDIGYVLVETGCIDRGSSYSGRYETIRLKIKYPLELRNGNIIPNSSVELLRETSEWEKPYQKRRDYTYRFGLIRTKADLSKVLPTEWFLHKKNI